jgi:hypothetical protein
MDQTSEGLLKYLLTQRKLCLLKEIVEAYGLNDEIVKSFHTALMNGTLSTTVLAQRLRRQLPADMRAARPPM